MMIFFNEISSLEIENNSNSRLLVKTRTSLHNVPFFDYEFYVNDFYVTIGNHFCDRVEEVEKRTEINRILCKRAWRFASILKCFLTISLSHRLLLTLRNIKMKSVCGAMGRRIKYCEGRNSYCRMEIQHTFAHWRERERLNAKRVEENPFFRHSILSSSPKLILCEKKSNWEEKCSNSILFDYVSIISFISVESRSFALLLLIPF